MYQIVNTQLANLPLVPLVPASLCPAFSLPAHGSRPFGRSLAPLLAVFLLPDPYSLVPVAPPTPKYPPDCETVKLWLQVIDSARSTVSQSHSFTARFRSFLSLRIPALRALRIELTTDN